MLSCSLERIYIILLLIGLSQVFLSLSSLSKEHSQILSSTNTFVNTFFALFLFYFTFILHPAGRLWQAFEVIICVNLTSSNILGLSSVL